MRQSQASPDPLIGRVLAGRYRVRDRLGSGGMGTVYAAEQLTMRRLVALKVLRPELAADPTMAARFEREARAATRVVSPHVVTLFDFGESEHLLYIAMELLRGESLGARLRREGTIAPVEATRIATAIARALSAAHAAQVVHRDLKPDNVHLAADGSVKVLDFGIAKILELPDVEGAAIDLTRAGAIVGTPAYMSPEAVGRTGVGPSSDLYALGVMLFEMLVGRPPFEETEPVLLMGMQLRMPPQLLREARAELEVPDELEQLVDRLLAKKPAHRPPSADAVVAELEAFARVPLADRGAHHVRAPAAPPVPPTFHSAPTATTPLATTAPATRAPARRLPATAVAIASGLLLVGVAAWASILATSVGDEPAPDVPSTAAPPRSTPVPPEPSPREPEQAIAEPEPTPIPAPAPVAEPEPTIELRLVREPRTARVTVDGRVVDGSVATLARDGAHHVVEATAPHHLPFRTEITADVTQQLPITLEPARRRPPRRTPVRREERPQKRDIVRDFP